MAERRETGRMDIEGDWPGVFIRGDDALGMAQSLQLLAGHYKIPNGEGSLLHGWMKLLQSCRVRS